MKVTARNLARWINELPRNQQYPYVNPKTKTVVRLDSVALPEGPIGIKRYDPHLKGASKEAKVLSISSTLLWRIANAIEPNTPFNLDRILGASYNYRSAIETLLAHSPQFYFCYPGRVELVGDRESIQKGHKHLIWCPDEPHELGKLCEKKVDTVISEIPNSVIYDSVVLSDPPEKPLDIEIQRRHAQIQVALLCIGQQLGFQTWIAQNDKGILYNQKRLCEHEGVVSDLRNVRLLESWTEAIHAALLIDCIWFKNCKLMPAVMEVEHSTGVRSGLLRMQKFKDALPSFPSRWVIVAPDSDRERVLREAQAPQFRSLKPMYFRYSAVEELYSLCSRRKLCGITEEFLDSFMEPLVA